MKKKELLKYGSQVVLMGFLVWLLIVGIDIGEKNMEKERLKEIQQQLSDDLSHYQEIKGLYSPSGWKEGISDGRNLTVTINGSRRSAKCSQEVSLSGDEASQGVRYVTNAPMGMLMQHEGQWFLAKVSKKHVDKLDVINHLKSCFVEIKKKIKREDKSEENHLKTWE